jgi:predicted RNA polymerase sigma factor
MHQGIKERFKDLSRHAETSATDHAESKPMTTNLEELLPSAKDLMAKIALEEADEAEKQARARTDADAEKKALIDQLRKPSGISDEEAIRRGLVIIQRAVKNRLTEVQVFQFPSQLCTDKGRAINQQEPGWEQTLTGVPQEIYNLWVKYFRPRGYKLRVQVIDFPGGLPGDVGMTLSWGHKDGV